MVVSAKVLRYLGVLALLGVWLVPAATARAQQMSMPAGASPWIETEQTQVRLIADRVAVGTTESIRLGLHFKLAPGWKVYWRSPGAAGFPPRVDWTGSANLQAAEMAWPAPERFSVLGLDTLGYKEEVVFPIDAVLDQPGNALRLSGRLTYLTCDEICIPYDADLSLDIPAGQSIASRYAHVIDRFEARVPGDGTTAGLEVVDAQVVAAGGMQFLEVVASASAPFDEPDVFVEGPDRFDFAAPTTRLSSDRRSAMLSIPVTAIGSDSPDLAGESLVLTVVDGDRSMEARVASVDGAVASDSLRTTVVILALALLGGFILNLMPCVLPVLSLKLLSVVKQGGAPPHAVRRGFLITAAGIVFSFLVIAAALVALKAGGIAVGWGIQFQQPLFLAVMAVVLALFAANLWGFFEIGLPAGLADRLGAPGRAESGLGHFMTGAFATLLATPCSAPFLGTAVGFALSRGSAEIAMVFLALGNGLALPYLAVAAAPRLARLLPRPGAWMAVLRRVLGVALIGTALWLLTVMAAQVDWLIALGVGAAVAAMVAALGLASHRRTVPGFAARIVAIAAIAAAVVLPLVSGSAAAPTAGADRAEQWAEFDRARIATLVREGKVVFVDVTADWCLTCQVNKALVLDRDPVAARLADPDLIAMVADWTRPDPAIADYLSRFGRYGIPFNAVYGPGAPKGLPLPELLTAEIVIDAIRRAAVTN